MILCCLLLSVVSFTTDDFFLKFFISYYLQGWCFFTWYLRFIHYDTYQLQDLVDRISRVLPDEGLVNIINDTYRCYFLLVVHNCHGYSWLILFFGNILTFMLHNCFLNFKFSLPASFLCIKILGNFSAFMFHHYALNKCCFQKNADFRGFWIGKFGTDWYGFVQFEAWNRSWRFNNFRCEDLLPMWKFISYWVNGTGNDKFALD